MSDIYLPLRASDFTLTHKWHTNIQISLNGTEKRSCLFSWPRVKINMTIPTGKYLAQAWMRRSFYEHVDDTWGLPIWCDLSSITSTATGSTIPCDTTGRHFYESRECMVINKLISSWDDYEICTISGVSDDTITISGALGKSWAAGSFVVPVYDFRTDFKGSIERHVQEYDRISIEGIESFETDRTWDYTPPASGTVTYRGKELFIFKPVSPKEEIWSRNSSLQQYLGKGFKHSYISTTGRKYENSFLLSAEETPEVLDFFDRHKGRYSTFWFPTWNKDIKAAQAINSSDTAIYIQDIDYDISWFLNDVIGRNIYIQFPDGSYTCRKITNATSSTIILNSAIGTSVSLNDLNKMYISFLELGRFDQDEIELEYLQGKRIAQTQLYFHGLINEADDYVPPPVSITAYPAASADDGYYYISWNNNFVDLALGDISGNNAYMFLRFQNVSVPQGATITEAYIRFTAYSNKTGTPVLTKIYFNDADNATAPTDWTTQQAKVKTTAVLDWDINICWVNDTKYNTDDLSDVIQEVVDRPGWVSGNAMMALIQDDGSASGVYKAASSYDYVSGAEKAELHITYSAE